MSYDVGINIKALDEFSATFTKLNQQFAKVQNSIQKTENKLAYFGSKMKGFGKNMQLKLTASILAGAGYAFKQVMNFDAINEQLTKVSGSSGKAKVAFEGMRRIATSTGWDPKEIADVESRFMGLGNSVDQAVKKTEIYSKAVIGSGHSLGELSSIMLRAETMAAKSGTKHGAFSARSAMQLIKTVPAISVEMQKLAVASGKTGDQFMAAFKAGTISINLVNEALERVAANTKGMSIEQNMMRLHNVFRLFVYDTAEAIAGTDNMDDAAQQLTDKVAEMESQFREFVQLNPGLVKIAAGFLGVVAIVGPLSILIGACLSPIGLITMGVMAIATAAVWAYNKFETFKNICNEIWEIIKKIGDVWSYLFGKEVQFAKWTYHKVSDALGFEAPREAYSTAGGAMIPQTQNVKATSNVNITLEDPNNLVKKVTSDDINTRFSDWGVGSYMTQSR